MGSDTKIEWAHHTFNPWVGCVHISPGCENCYAEGWANRGLWRGWLDKGWTPAGDLNRGIWGAHGARLFAPDRYWEQLDRWDRAAGKAGERRRVFVASMADVLERSPVSSVASAMYVARGRLADAIVRCSMLDFLIVTKRPGNWFLFRNHLRAWVAGASQVQRNLWLIVSAEDQRRADERIPSLLQADCVAVRGVSYEPALGPVDFLRACDDRASPGVVSRIDWVIAGSESGPGARPADLGWIRSARDQCRAGGVAFFLKQWHGQIRGSKESLPKLDGQVWAQFPEVTL